MTKKEKDRLAQIIAQDPYSDISKSILYSFPDLKPDYDSWREFFDNEEAESNVRDELFKEAIREEAMRIQPDLSRMDFSMWRDKERQARATASYKEKVAAYEKQKLEDEYDEY